MSVMIVMPTFTECQQRYPPAIARVVTGFESRFPPQMCSRIDEPRRMQTQRKAQEYSPQHYAPPAKRKKHQAHYYVPLIIVGLMLFAFGGWGVMLWGIFLRLTLCLHATWLVNSATHLWGKTRFETGDD